MRAMMPLYGVSIIVLSCFCSTQFIMFETFRVQSYNFFANCERFEYEKEKKGGRKCCVSSLSPACRVLFTLLWNESQRLLHHDLELCPSSFTFGKAQASLAFHIKNIDMPRSAESFLLRRSPLAPLTAERLVPVLQAAPLPAKNHLPNRKEGRKSRKACVPDMG